MLHVMCPETDDTNLKPCCHGDLVLPYILVPLDTKTPVIWYFLECHFIVFEVCHGCTPPNNYDPARLLRPTAHAQKAVAKCIWTR